MLLKNWDDLDDKEKSIYQSQIYQRDFQKSLQKQIDGFLKDLNSGQYESISKYLEGCYETGFIGTMYDLHGQGVPLIMPIDQKNVIKAVHTNSKISKRLYTKLGEDVDHLKKRIANNLSRGIATADSYANIARNIANDSNVGFNRAMRISRTEGHRIQANSAYDAQLAAKDAGADIVKQWDASLDGKTRPHHRQLDGQIRELEEPFEIGGMKAMYPSGFGSASEDINCRCALLQRATWALDDDELETLKERAAFYGLDKTDSFNDFRQKYLKVTTEPKKTAVNAPAPLKSAKGTVHGKSAKPTGTMPTQDVLSFTAEQSEAIEWYVSGDGMWINQYLRGNGDFDALTDTENELLKLLTSATNRDLPEDITKLYRSVDASVIFNNIRVEEWDEFYQFVKYGSDTFGKGAYAERLSQKMQKILDSAKGKTITEKGFMSTTKEYDVVADWYGFTGSDMPVVLELDVPKGIKGADLKNFDIEGNEQFEVLLARNMKYEIGEISAKDGNIYIKAKLKASKGLGAKIGGEGLIALHEEPALLKKIDYSKKKVIQNELKDFEKDAIKESIETACVITTNGEVYKCYGIEDRVFPDYDLGDKLKGASVSHNHPIDETVFSFSKDDLQLFMEYDLDVLRGCDEKYIYEFTRNSSEIDEPMEDWMNFENYNHVDIIRLAKEYGIGYRRWKNE